MISHINKEETVRIQKSFDDGFGQYRYLLEKWVPPKKVFGITIILGHWFSGEGGIGGFRTSTTNKKTLNAWIKHYKLEEANEEA
jgi:hypothetical protein